jgi:recombinational DNA repair protein (RecF pathway)
MSVKPSLYWIARCDGCGKPITAHAMSVLREAMLCLECLGMEAEAMAADRAVGRTVMFAPEPAVERRVRGRRGSSFESKGSERQVAGALNQHAHQLRESGP